MAPIRRAAQRVERRRGLSRRCRRLDGADAEGSVRDARGEELEPGAGGRGFEGRERLRVEVLRVVHDDQANVPGPELRDLDRDVDLARAVQPLKRDPVDDDLALADLDA